MKTCSDCNQEKTFEEYYTKGTGIYKAYYESYCKECSKVRARAKAKGRTRSQRQLDIINSREKERRKDPNFKAEFLLQSARCSDRSKGMAKGDLDKPFIEKLIAAGCLYCGETDVMSMSIDRIDNELGHLQSNVNPSCLRCNLVRGNMPYLAWLEIAAGMRKARLAGLFGEWDGPLLRRKSGGE